MPEAIRAARRRRALLSVLWIVVVPVACGRGRPLPAGVGAAGPLACPRGAQPEASEISVAQGGGHQERCINAAGQRHGPSRGFFPDGQIRYYTEWWEGRRQGKFASWWPNGQQKAEGAQRDWEPVGVWTNWDASGRITSQHDYATGPYPAPTSLERAFGEADTPPS